MPAEGHYQQLLDLSQRMLAAGMAQQWDELVRLEQQRRVVLKTHPAATRSDSPQQVIELINKIQACDSELREKLEAWMAHARTLLRLDAHPSPER